MTIRRFTPVALVAVAAAALLAPAGAQALPRGFFGVTPQTALTPGDTGRMRFGGLETIRAQLTWAAIQPTPRSGYQWESFDAVVAAAARDRLEVLPFLYGTPEWTIGDYRRLPVYNARQRRGWSAFVRAAVERYGPRGSFWREHGPGSAEPLPRVPIRTWQIWNEPNFFYFTRPASPKRYAQLLKISDRAAERGHRGARVVMGGLFGEPRQGPPRAMDADRFLERVYRVRGIKGSFDGVALHPYAADNRDLRQLVERSREVMLDNGDRRTGLYITELGWGSERNSQNVSFEVGWRPQARELRRAYRYLITERRLNVKRIDWFTWKDLQGSCSFCDSSGLFREGAGFRSKPAWHSFRWVTRRFGG